MSIRKNFNKSFFKDIHARLVENLSGQIQIKLSEQDEPNIDEYFIQDKTENILDRRTTKIENSLKVVRNKGHKPLKDKINQAYNLNLNPEFDIRILGADYKMLYAVYEIKSRLSNNALNKNDIYKDIQRLAIVKALYPKAKCMFILPGLFTEMKNDFQTKGINIPHTFNINQNPNYDRKGGYVLKKIPYNILDNDYSKLLNYIGITDIKIRLSQTFRGRRYILFTYEINN